MDKALKVIQLIFLLICIFFITEQIYVNEDTLMSTISAAKTSNIVFAFILWSLLSFIVSYFSYSVTENYSKQVTYTYLLCSYINRLPAKYIPGGIWHTVARSHDLLKKGLNKRKVSLLVFYENFWPVLINAFISGAAIYFYHNEVLWKTTALLSLLLSLSTILVLILFRNKSWVLPLPTYLKLTIVSILFWLLAAAAFMCYLSAFDIFVPTVRDIFSYMFSWLIGFLSIFTPQGIGVFELTMTQLSTLSAPINEAIIVIGGFRLIVLASDAFCWLIYFFLKQFISKPRSTQLVN